VKNIFKFSSAENKFDLEIRFHNTADFDDKNVLRALKVAFDNIQTKD